MTQHYANGRYVGINLQVVAVCIKLWFWLLSMQLFPNVNENSIPVMRVRQAWKNSDCEHGLEVTDFPCGQHKLPYCGHQKQWRDFLHKIMLRKLVLELKIASSSL